MLFFFNDTATTEIYTLSLHDALPIFQRARQEITAAVDLFAANEREACHDGLNALCDGWRITRAVDVAQVLRRGEIVRSEEHTSELQSRQYLVCRLLLEKKKKKRISSK